MSRTLLLASLAVLLKAPCLQFCENYKISKNPSPLKISKVIRNGFERCLPMTAQIRFKVDYTYYQQFFRTWCRSLSSCYEENGKQMQQRYDITRKREQIDTARAMKLGRFMTVWSYPGVHIAAKRCSVEKIGIEMLKFNMSASDIIKVGRVLVNYLLIIFLAVTPKLLHEDFSAPGVCIVSMGDITATFKIYWAAYPSRQTRGMACAMEPMDTIDIAMFSLKYVYKTTG